MAEQTFKLPDLGEGLHEAEIVTWHVSVGDHVVVDQPLVSVETDKAVVEVPSPRAGRIAALHGAEGEMIQVGSPLVEFEEAGAGSEPGAIVGELPQEETPLPAETAAERSTHHGGRVRAAPAVRALAEREGVDLTNLSGSGPAGAITTDDVRHAAAASSSAGPLEPLRGVRRAMAKRMAEAHAAVVPATVSDEADVEAWAGETADVTVRLARALAVAAAAEPALNAWFDAAAEGRRLLQRVDLGIAVDTPDGLFVPVLRDVGARDAKSLRAGLERMKVDLLARTIPPEELRGASITLSNFGMIAGRWAAPVVVPPQVAIVSAGRIAPRVVALDGQPAVRRLLPLSLTFDHRVVTGGEAARFLKALIEDLEKES